MSWTDWMRGQEVEPSLYAADLSRLGDQVRTLLDAGARIFHFDIGDGHFVPPITIGPIVLQWISPLVHEAGGRLDCHLMTMSPERHFGAIAEAGGDSVTVHFEACSDLERTMADARSRGLGVGVAFNPETSPQVVGPAVRGADLVLCMSIEPGYSGQAFMPAALERVAVLRGLLPAGIHVQVDGGVGADNVRELREAGADLLVAGTSIFGAADPGSAYESLARAAV
ncbi:MAG: ribulose-phosphate 3-epimerase [Actinobacteria bacterium]|nr:ribulose-phosphate 3-epimerase [Actinomycetota bacterium]